MENRMQIADESSGLKRVHRLSEDVVRKINAGEVIVRPVSAVKELIENCLDAGATRIIVRVKDGGKTMIQVVDNGKGIHKDDLMIICKPHTTSKLEKYEDLLEMETYGFRGEALSSISIASDVTIISKTSDSPVAYKMTYKSGMTVHEPKSIAGNQGTIVTMENIFASMPVKRASLRSSSEEYSLIADLITKYAIHLSNLTSFTLCKDKEINSDIFSSLGNQSKDNIREFYGKDVADSLIPISADSDRGIFKMTGLISDANYSGRKSTFILFINNRLVDCVPLKKSIDILYSGAIVKNILYFVYLSLKIDSKIVDVNFHPAKEEVRFLYDDYIFAEINRCISEKLSGSCSSMRIPLQVLSKPSVIKETKEFRKSSALRQSEKVRTDHCSQSLDDLWERNKAEKVAGKNSHRREIELSSVLSLRETYYKKCDQSLKDILRKSCFVGCVNKKLLLISHEVKLISLNLPKFSKELFYQLYLEDFGNFGVIQLKNLMNIDRLLKLYYRENFNGKECNGCKNLKSKRVKAMLEDYFSIGINENDELFTLPLVITGYLPNIVAIPDFIYRLEEQVDWMDEKKCFCSIGRAIASFYGGDVPRTDDWKKIIKSVIYPAFKTKFIPPSRLKDDYEIRTTISDLYKVFERC